MFTRLWRGEVNLAFVFWVLGILISPLFLWITFRLGKFLPVAWSMPIILGMWVLYGVIISLIIWRSSKKYTGRKVWSILSRIAICTAWVIFLGIGFGVFYIMRFDFFTNSYTIEKELEADPAYPYIGFWKNDCSDNFGLAIEKAANGEYYVRFCGPGGCFGKTSFMRTKLINDPKYKILDNDTIGVNVLSASRGLNSEEEKILKQRTKNGLLIYKRCNSEDMVSIVSMEPKHGTVLSSGSKILIKAKLNYRLISSQDGEICIVVQDQVKRQLLKQPPNKCVRLTRGSGFVNFEESVEISSRGVNEIDIFFPLLAGHSEATEIGAYERYAVR